MTEHVQKGILIVLFAILLALIFDRPAGIVNGVALLVGLWGLVVGFVSNRAESEPDSQGTEPTADSPD